jgi:hypothetical protein
MARPGREEISGDVPVLSGQGFVTGGGRRRAHWLVGSGLFPLLVC